MNYLGFFCLGMGILTSAIGLLCGAIATFSKEVPIRHKALFYAKCIVPIATCLLGLGVYLIFIKMAV